MKLKSFFLELLSFSTPRAIVINISSIFLALRLLPTNVLSGSPITCVFKTYIIPLFFQHGCLTYGFFAFCNCPACGITRGMSRLLHGDLFGAIGYNKLVIPVFGIMIFLLVLNAFRLYKNKTLK
ncbi:MAG: DUF2752 domain-containing protein [Candidatus Woesearchaeota archaeon]|jgi:hypothetical protein